MMILSLKSALMQESIIQAKDHEYQVRLNKLA